MSKKSTIPLHYLREETELELYLHRMDGMDPDVTLLMESHRDDHCNFFFQEKGSSRLMVDFREVTLEGCGVFCILPGQVHRPIYTSGATGWFMATDMATVDESYRSVFEEYVSTGEPVSLNEDQAILLGTCMQLLSDFSRQTDTTIFRQPVLRSMAQVCLGMFASFFKNNEPGFSATLRPALITRQFKSLLLENFKTMKSPAEYAHALNITPSYLNEVVKETTGLPVSQLIHQEIIMEAKRLLYYTDLSVKQIAFSLGYEDHTYFSRLFRKVTQLSAGQFRESYRK